MENKYWIAIIGAIVILVIGVIVYSAIKQTEETYIPEHRNASNNASINNQSSNNSSGNVGIWSGIIVEMEFTKDGVTKNVSGDINFIFSEKPLLLIQSYNLSKDDKSGVFLIRTSDEVRLITMTVGEVYYYEPSNLTIKLNKIDTRGACPEGVWC